MTSEQQTQLKAIAFQASNGNLDNAKALFAWFAEDYINAAVATQVAAASVQQLQIYADAAAVAPSSVVGPAIVEVPATNG